jgi:ppGpp synthetase/RelA/SpoT-type nucleotidyltranferase
MAEKGPVAVTARASREDFATWFAQKLEGDWYLSSTVDPSPIQAPLYLPSLSEESRKESYEAAEQIFKNFTNDLAAQFKVSHFWLRLVADLKTQNDHHNVVRHHFLLGTSVADSLVVTKSLDSVVLKAYRRNILSGATKDSPPSGGWITPGNFLTSVRDIVRTTFVVKYLDGAELLVGLIERVATETGIGPPDVDYEARDNGYYAIHTVAWIPFALDSNRAWKSERTLLPVEIQICTQVQETVRNVTHDLYEERRAKAQPTGKKWQWTPSCEEFVPNYVAHTLHYCEGMIMRLRNKQERGLDESRNDGLS